MAPRIEPFFLEGSAGRLFVQHWPGKQRSPLWLIPPPGEEMNKSRRMLALMAQEMASRGQPVIMMDWYGTGDSEGDFADARWPIWQADLALMGAWLRRRYGNETDVLALRLGAALFANASQSAVAVRNLALWQPVSNPRLWLDQWLRVRLAAGLISGPKSSETPKALRQRLANGESIEVGGYRLHPEWVAAMDALRLPGAWTEAVRRVAWFELLSETQAEVSPATAKALRQLHGPVDLKPVEGIKFWATQEITTVPALIQSTADWLLAPS